MTRRTTRAIGVALVAGLALSTTTLDLAPTARAAVGPGAAAAPFLAPFYTEGDLTGDEQVTQADLDRLVAALGTRDGEPGWDAVAPADLDADGQVDVADLSALSEKIVYDDGSFSLVEASALEMQKAMNAGVTTSVELTQDYLRRIAAYDKTLQDPGTGGRVLNSVLTTGGEALAAAAESDALRARDGGPRSMLDGIPVLVKDNYDTRDMPTSAGCACWQDNQTADDAFMVEGMRADGAIILGKASLDEFAFGFSSTWSTGLPYNPTPTTGSPNGTNGAALVASPYNTTRTAGGSSGGTGAAISANLGAIGFGTDTGGSIRNPASYNQLVGVRPTTGLASRDGIVPLALSQDTGGPIGRSVEDVAIALDAVVGTDPADPATAEADAQAPTSYTSSLDPDALAGQEFAYFTSMVPPATATGAQAAGRRIFLDAVADLREQGATVEEIDPATLTPDPSTGVTIAAILGEGSGSTNEFKHDLTEYVARHLDPDVAARSLAAIVASGRHVPAYRGNYTSRDAVTQQTYDAWIGTAENPGTHAKLIRDGRAYLTGLMDAREIDAIVYPTALPYSTYSTNLRLSPNTGMPAVSVPAGQTTATETLPGAGVNLELLGRAYDEGDLLGLAYSYEQATEHRTSPARYGVLAGDVVDGPGTDADAPGDGAVTLTGPTQPVRAGDTFTVTVAQSAADLRAYDLELGYDPGRVTPLTTTSGTTGSTATSTSGGVLSVTHTKLGTSPAAQGATTLATVTFRALTTGSAGIALRSITTVDDEGDTATPAAPGAVSATVLPRPTTGTIPAPVPSATTVSAELAPGRVVRGREVDVTVRVAAPTATPASTPTGRVVVRVLGTRVVRSTGLVAGKADVSFVARRGPGGPRVKNRQVVITYVPDGAFLPSTQTRVLRVRR